MGLSHPHFAGQEHVLFSGPSHRELSAVFRKLVHGGPYHPYFSENSEKIVLEYLHVSPMERGLRGELFDASGLTEAEISVAKLIGPLDELRASNLQTGPQAIFSRPFASEIGLTQKPSEHLTFALKNKRQTIVLLDIPSIFKIYLPQRVGLVTY